MKRSVAVLWVAMALVAQFSVSTGAVTGKGDARSRPNILFVLTDDLDLASMRYVPHVAELVGEAGATLDNFFVNVSWCCPSRVTILRGQYAHNTGIKTNGGANGGFEVAHALGLEEDTVATRLQRAGYRTALLGKYLNGYPGTAGSNYVPPGWDTWASPIAGDPYSQYGYTLNENGSPHSYGTTADDYGDDVYLRLARQFIEGAARDSAPFFAYVSLFAPHDPATPAPEDRGAFAGATADRGPAFDQPDVSAMPSHVASLPRLSAADLAEIDVLHRQRLASLQNVGRGVAELIDTLRSTGQLENTYVIFTSDNGYHLGQHRLPAGKQTPYDTDTRVPMLVRGPGIRPGSHVDALTGNVDLAPTFADLAGIEPAQFTDGRSLVGLLRNDDETVHAWRTAYLLEHWRESDAIARASATGRSTLLEPPDLDQRRAGERHTDTTPVRVVPVRFDFVEQIPQFTGIRTERFLYVEYVTGDRELYDVRADPEQIHNLAATASALEQRLARRLAELRTCRAAQCRRAEARS